MNIPIFGSRPWAAAFSAALIPAVALALDPGDLMGEGTDTLDAVAADYHGRLDHAGLIDPQRARWSALMAIFTVRPPSVG